MRGKSGPAAIIFDLDGTLIDTADDLAASMNYALGEHGLAPVSHGAVRHLVGFGARKMLAQGFQLSAGRAALEEELDHGLELFLKHYRKNIAVHSRPFEGAVEMIERLREVGYRMAICTNKREVYARQLIEELALGALFDAIIGADSAAAPKPDPAPVRMALAEAGAERGVFIGDSDTDILAAQAAELPCLITSFGYGPLTRKEGCAAIFDSYRDAQSKIEELARP